MKTTALVILALALSAKAIHADPVAPEPSGNCCTDNGPLLPQWLIYWWW